MKNEWWKEEYGFFGEHYLKGDDSKEGYLLQEQTLAERTEKEVEGVIRLLNLIGKEKILDIPSGYGRHGIRLAEKGFMVTGSDINSFFLKRARETAVKKGVNPKFVKESMIDIKYEQEFDAVINMFYSFGFFETDAENKKVVSNFYKALKPSGKFLMHTDVNLARIRNGKYKFEEKRSLQNGETLKIIDTYNPRTKRIDGSWEIAEKIRNYSVRVYEVDEFVTLCKSVGFKDVRVYSDWSGKKYNEESEMLIFVAEK
jgi:SAM-dependent methyltransferase